MRFLPTVLVLSLSVAAIHAGDESVSFSRDVLPILSDACFACHGPDGNARKAKLRLDLEADAFADRDGVPAIVASKPEQSELIARIFHDDPDESMPPSKSDRQLTDREKDTLKRWVTEGAAWQAHWSFVPPERPAFPKVAKGEWPRNGIDPFILARLEREGLAPSPEASKETLIRRVTLDLNGVPPTPEEVDAFLADDSDDAYKKVVDRLLRSKRYGETMALTWLDAARYADTDGYQYKNGPRNMWRWRDWVIDAYNRHLSFDQFTIEQLAGDLLPNPTLDQLIATGFNRNHRYNSESGLVIEEFLLENAVDRVDTTSTVWLGLTMGCARCHDHKYDPLSQRDYYQLIAFFNAVPEAGRAIKSGNSEPYITAPLPDQAAKLAEFDEKVASLEKFLASEKTNTALDAWAGSVAAGNAAIDRALVARNLEKQVSLEGFSKEITRETGEPKFVPGVFGNAMALDGESIARVGKFGRFRADDRFTVSFWLRPHRLDRGVILSRQKGGTTRPGLAAEIRDGRLQYYLISRWIAGAGVVETAEPLIAGKWVHVTLTNDGSQSANGQKIYLDGEEVTVRVLNNTNSNTGGVGEKELFRVGGGVHGPMFAGAVDDLRFYPRTLWPEEAYALSEAMSVAAIAKLPADRRTSRQQAKLRAWFLEHGAPEAIRKSAAELAGTRIARQKYHDSLPDTMVMRDVPDPAPTHIRIRGVYHDSGERVERGVPAAFPEMPGDYPKNRLGFARWLVNGKHPLTARVTVNRYWQRYFGTGLVKTSEDFGVQGEPPSHPELLDWLASEFVGTGWDVAGIQKLIVMSATYRQASRLTPELRERDPENRLLARASRLRLPGHVLRDQALFASGLLKEQIGGPSVSPYQPANLWAEMSMGMKYRQSKGGDLYRRSLYTIWKRTVNPPSMAILDAADREACWVKTKRTNTPLQALTLLNETAFVESARHLAARILTEDPDHPAEYGFRLVAGRKPAARELALLSAALEEYRKEYRKSPDEAAKLIATGASPVPKNLDAIELAAHTALANVLLNLDEAVTRE